MTSNGYIAIIRQCFRMPGRDAYWDDAHQVYVCPDEVGIERIAIIDAARQRDEGRPKPDLRGKFTKVFVVSLLMTVLLIVLCIASAVFLFDQEVPELKQIIFKGLVDLALMGFTGVFGLLTGAKLQAK